MWHVDISDWSMYEIRRWHVAQKSGDIDTLNELMAAVIIMWPYDADPSDPLDYDLLTTQQWNHAVLQIDAAIESCLHIGDRYPTWYDD